MKMRFWMVAIVLVISELWAGKVFSQNLDINDQSGQVNDTVSFTVSINNASNSLESMQFDISYDSSVLDYTDNFTKGSLVSGFTYFDVRETSTGQIRIAGITTSALESGVSGEVVKLAFTVKSCSDITLTPINLEDDLSGWSTGNGQFTCSTTTVTPSPTPETTPEETPTPGASPIPIPCEVQSITVSYSSLTLKRLKSGDVTVTVTGADDCAVEGETVTATINAAGKNRISISPTSDTTDDENGQATFTITAKKKIGNARVTFKVGSVKKSITVKVRK